MRMDVKIGMIGGTILCLAAIVWFCAKQQIIPSPLSKIQNQRLSALPAADKKNPLPQDNKPIVIAPPYKEIQPQVATQDINNNAASIIHTVTKGQSLSDISRIYYDTPNGWKRIYQANIDKLPRGPDSIRPGMQLIIPPKD